MNTAFKKIALASALVSGLALGLPAFAQSGSSTEDAALAQQVRSALTQDRHLQDADDDFAVSADNGVVKITGWMTYAEDVQTAEAIAKNVPGVRDVETQMHIWSTNSRPGI